MKNKTVKPLFNNKKQNYKILFLLQIFIIMIAIIYISLDNLNLIEKQYYPISGDTLLIMLVILSGLVGLSSMCLFNEIVKLIEREKKYELKEIEFTQMKEYNDLLKSQKHDFSNNLQVVWGMMSIGKTDKARKYIENYTNMLKINEDELEDIKHIDSTYLYALFLNKYYKCKEKDIHISFDMDQDVSIEKFNPVDIVCIFGNLLDNAIYAVKDLKKEQREIFVEIYNSNKEIFLGVCNKGPEIPSDMKIRIFKKGFTTKGGNGSGLGLCNVKELVDKYNGKIWIESDKYIGTKFVISFPK